MSRLRWQVGQGAGEPQLVLPILGPALFSAIPDVGQDWDCSLHQLGRAVVAMHHLGHPFTASERALVRLRLQQWSALTCENFGSSCPSGISVPTERQFWTGRCGGDPAGPNLAVNPAPLMFEVLSGALALVRSGLVDIGDPAALSMASQILDAVATLYRADSGGSGWAEFDSAEPADPPAGATLDGTYAAIATLLVLDRGPFAGCSGLSSPAPLGLDGFLHVFGGFIPTMLAAGLWPWPAIYQPG